MDRNIRKEFLTDFAKIDNEDVGALAPIIERSVNKIKDDVEKEDVFRLLDVDERYDNAKKFLKSYYESGCEFCNDLFFEYHPIIPDDRGYLVILFYLSKLFQSRPLVERLSCKENDECLAKSNKDEIVFYSVVHIKKSY